MSELKITKDTIQNSILKEGKFVFGHAYPNASNNDGYISASGWGAVAHGRVENNGKIKATGIGAHAEGGASALSFEFENLIAKGSHSHAEGFATSAIGNNSHAEGKGMNGKRYEYTGGAPWQYLDVVKIP